MLCIVGRQDELSEQLMKELGQQQWKVHREALRKSFQKSELIDIR